MSNGIANILARGTVLLVNAALKMQSLQIRLMANEPISDIEHFEPYGYTSRAKKGAEAIAVFFDGDRSHGVVLCVADRRYRIKGLEEGEVALYDDQGQSVILKRDGIVINGGGKPVLVTDTPAITLDAPMVTVTGNLQVNQNIVATGDISDHVNKSMSAMRAVYGGHDHNEHGTGGGVTSNPNQGM